MKTIDFRDSSVARIARSGARGGRNQLLQLGGMRGPLADIEYQPMEIPVKRNFREGISPLEFYIGSHAGRRSMCEKKLLTAPAGDFTRMMIEGAYHLVIKGEDCRCDEGLFIFPFPEIESTGLQELPTLSERLIGRSQIDGTIIDRQRADELEKHDAPVCIRSPLTCWGDLLWGYGALCRRCYGWDLSTRCLPEIGLPVGILAGESIGERGTQLTMHTFHTGGVGGGMITEGLLSRIKKIFGNGDVSLPLYRVHSPGDSYLRRNDAIDDWELLLSVSRIPVDGVLPVISPFKSSKGYQPVTFKKLMDVVKSHGLQGLSSVIAYEACRAYENAIDQKHFETIAKSLLSYDEYGLAHVTGIRSVPFRQPGFLAAAAFQRAIQVLSRAAASATCDPLTGYKTRLMVGKSIKEDNSNDEHQTKG